MKGKQSLLRGQCGTT